MANVKDISTIGVKVGIAIEQTAGTMPEAGYTAIPKVKELPDLDFAPDSIDTTTFDNLEYKSSIDGLKDTGGVLNLSANYTESGVKLWDAQCAKETEGKNNWLVVYVPTVKTQYFIPINAIPTGLPTITINDVLAITYKFTVVADIVKKEITDPVTTLFTGTLE